MAFTSNIQQTCWMQHDEAKTDIPGDRQVYYAFTNCCFSSRLQSSLTFSEQLFRQKINNFLRKFNLGQIEVSKNFEIFNFALSLLTLSVLTFPRKAHIHVLLVILTFLKNSEIVDCDLLMLSFPISNHS